MSYNMELMVLKNNKFDEEVDLHKSLQLEYSYVDFAESCSYLFENVKNDDLESEEYGRYIINGCGSGYRIFQKFFTDVENCSWILVDKKRYVELKEWLENEMKNLTLFDVHDEEIAWEYLHSYNQVKYELGNINFDNEFVVFSHCY